MHKALHRKHVKYRFYIFIKIGCTELDGIHDWEYIEKSKEKLFTAAVITIATENKN